MRLVKKHLSSVNLNYSRRHGGTKPVERPKCPHHDTVLVGTARLSGFFCLIRRDGDQATIASPVRCCQDKDHFTVEAALLKI